MSEQRTRQQVVPVHERTDAFVNAVVDKDRRAALLASLPAHVRPERFERNLVVAVNNHPRLLECQPGEVFNEVAKAAALGLFLDPTLGEAYLITGWNGKERRLVPQLRLGYRGLIKLGRQSGEIAAVYAHAVHENDTFKASMGTAPSLVHEPDFMHDRGREVLYYAVVQYRDGTIDFEPMSVEAINAIRDRSDGYRAWQDKKIPSTPWASDYGEMAKKTVLRRLMKRLPQSPEIGDALAIEDEDFREPPAIPPPSLKARLQAGHTARQIGFSRERVEQALQEPEEAMHAVLEGDDIPDAVKGLDGPPEAQDEPAPAEPVARELEAPPQAAAPADPLAVPMHDLTPDERGAWCEAFKAKVISVKTADAGIGVWKTYFERQIKPLYDLDRALYDALDAWMQSRVKKLREGAQ